MKIPSRLFLAFTLFLFLLISCAPQAPTPDINQQINQIVAATIMAWPTNAPPPTLMPYPTPTPFDLTGFFCEYRFCIGHPKDVAFFDQQNHTTPSNYSQGVIAAFNSSVFIQLTWQLAPGTADPQFMLDLIVSSAVDTRTGNLDVKLVRGMNVVYTSLTSTFTTLAYGGAGAWTCGDRVFAWKTYTQQADTASSLFEEALAKFTCGQKLNMAATNGIYIRHAKPDDLESFRELRLEALKNHPDAFGQDYFEAAAKDKEYWENRLQINAVEDALFFAEKDSQLLGMTGIHRSMSKKAKHAAMIWGVYVRPKWRGKHISEDLIRSCMEWAKGQAVVIIKLGVVTGNLAAIRSYERCGFKTYGTEPKAIFYDGIYYDEYLMSFEMKI